MLKIHTSANKNLGICTLKLVELPGAIQMPGNISTTHNTHTNGVSCLKTIGATLQFKLWKLPCSNAAELLDQNLGSVESQQLNQTAMFLTTANCLLSFICSASTVTLWKRWGCMWLHMWGNHQNSFLCLSSISSPSSSSSVPTESRKGSAKTKGRMGAQCFKAVASTLQYWVIPTDSCSF